MLVLAKNKPGTNPTLTIEPRVLDAGNVTTWDLAIESWNKLVEVKIGPSRQDVLDWLSRIASAHRAGETREFRLVYCSTERTRLILTLRKLIRVAKEAPDEAYFQKAVALEGIQNAE